MLRLQVKSIGSGTPNDPYRVNLPTYRMVSHDEKAHIAVVDVPDHAHPFTLEELAAMPKKEHKDHGELHAPTTAHLKTLHKWHDATYVERRGEFRIELT